jgi:hypothetical protein
MTVVARDEIPELRALRDAFDQARDALMAGIYEQFDRGEKDARIARSVDWTREYIGKIRKARDSKPSE